MVKVMEHLLYEEQQSGVELFMLLKVDRSMMGLKITGIW